MLNRRSFFGGAAAAAGTALAGCAATASPSPAIAKLSEANELFPGDVIYLGTPENVGSVVRGDVIEMHIDKLPNLSVRIV